MLEPLAGVLYCRGLSAQQDDATAITSDVVSVLQAFKQAGKTAPLYLLTAGVQAIENHQPSESALWQAPLWGLARVIQQEHPEFHCRCIDLSPDVKELSSLVNELYSASTENQVALYGEHRYVARLSAAGVSNNKQDKKISIHADGSYLITGGLGALGLQMANHLISSGARHLLLSGRSGAASSEQQAAIKQLQAQGAEVEIVQADIAQADDVAKLLQQAPKPLRGIIHAAGVLDDGMLMQQNSKRFARVAAPKIQGAWHLHTQTQALDQPLDFFVLFSSVASMLGSVAQANYAAANAFMDALAHYRKSLGLAALAINWGPWAEVGMASTESVKRRLANEGWDTIRSDQAWQITQSLLQHSTAQAGVIPIDWAQFTEQVPGAKQWPILADISAQLTTSGQAATANKASINVEQLNSVSPEQQQTLLIGYLQERASQTLRVPAEQLDAHQALSNLGIDSLIAVELRSWVQNDLQLDLPLERFLTTPTIHDLALVMQAQLCSDGSSEVSDQSHASHWVTYPKPNPQAQIRLFCFPYAGGGASVYRQWSALLPDNLELCPIQYPGREERLQETLYTDLSALVAALLPDLRPHLDKPFAFFGHSMGAVLAYEVARQLQQQGDPEPVHLLLSARAAPQITSKSVPMRFLDDQNFMTELHRLYDAVPEVIRQNTELQELFLPILRADVSLLETHEYIAGERLNCPISVFGGEQDRSVTAEALAAWSEQTKAAFSQQLFLGEHFYINDARETLIVAITESFTKS